MTTITKALSAALFASLLHSVLLSDARAETPKYDAAQISHFQEQFPVSETPPLHASSFAWDAESNKPLAGVDLEICLSLLKTAVAAPDLSLHQENRCDALTQFQIAAGVKAFHVAIPRGEKQTARAFLLFRGNAPLTGVLVAEERRAVGRETKLSTFIEDIDQDGDLELARFEFRKAESDTESKNAENIFNYFSWDRDHFTKKALEESDPVIKTFVKLHRWRIFNEPMLPDGVRETPDGYAVRLLSGKEVQLKNIDTDSDARKVYGYAPSPLEARFFLFHVGFYESGQTIRVDRKNGEISVSPGPVIYSPSVTSFVTATDMNDEYYYAETCAFEIWRFSGEYFIKEYSYTCKEGESFYGPPVWKTDEELTYQKGFYTDDGIRRRDAKLVHKGELWQEELGPEK